MNKAICITLPVALIEYLDQQHINKSTLIEELLVNHFKNSTPRFDLCVSCNPPDICPKRDLDHPGAVYCCTCYRKSE